MNVRTALFLVAGAALSGCSGAAECSPTSPARCTAQNRSAASSINGAWMLSQPNALGTTLFLSLTSNDTTLQGTGNYGNQSRPVTATGYVYWQAGGNTPGGWQPAGPRVVLNLVFGTGRTATFDQGTIANGTLSGVLTFSDSLNHSYGLSFVREPTA